MAYIGKTPTVGNFQVCDAISVVNGQAAYTLQVGGVNVTPESANHMLVSLNGILQKPGSSFTVSGSTMTFASNLATGDVIDFVQILGNVLDIGQPSDDTVTAAKLNDNVISGQTALAATPDDTDELLISDGGTIKRIDFSHIKGGGKIGQVVSTNKTDTFSQSVSSAGDSNIVTGLTVDITPSATSSKILIFVNVSIGVNGQHGIGFKLFRDSTQIDLPPASSNRRQNSKGMQSNAGGTSYNLNLSTNFLDSPSSTSQITYGIKINHTSSSSKGMTVNTSYDDSDDAKLGRQASTITAMEVLA